MRVLILGYGPAGRAVWSAINEHLSEQDRDWNVIAVDSAPQPAETNATSRDFGAQFLWEPIPGFECRQVAVETLINSQPATPDLIRKYKHSVGRAPDDHDDRREWAEQFRLMRDGFEIERWPETKGLDVIWNTQVRAVELEQHVVETNQGFFGYDTLVNTIALPTFLRLCNGDKREDGLFAWKPVHVWVKPFKTSENLIRVNYHADDGPVYRETERGGQLHVESLYMDGVPQWGEPDRTLYPGKIWTPDKEKLRQRLNELEHHGVHCFGRFGCWNQEALLHRTYRAAEVSLMGVRY